MKEAQDGGNLQKQDNHLVISISTDDGIYLKLFIPKNRDPRGVELISRLNTIAKTIQKTVKGKN